METQNVTLRQLRRFLHNQGYKCNCINRVDDAQYLVIWVADDDTAPKVEELQFYRDYGYVEEELREVDDLNEFMESLFCGGLYTAVATFYQGRNITPIGENLATWIPRGDQKIDE